MKVLLREGRIQVAGLENGNESFEKRYASSNDTEIHHYPKLSVFKRNKRDRVSGCMNSVVH